MSQLRTLAEPIPQQFIGKSDRGMDAADHTVITQRMLQVIGPHSFELVEVLRSEAPTITTQKGKEFPGGLYVTGVIARLRCVIDGVEVSVEEAGGCEQAALKDGDGERMKHAMSDAYKRCAMRLGLGLHIWAQDMYFLDRELDREAGGTVEEAPEVDDEQQLLAAQLEALAKVLDTAEQAGVPDINRATVLDYAQKSYANAVAATQRLGEKIDQHEQNREDAA